MMVTGIAMVNVHMCYQDPFKGAWVESQWHLRELRVRDAWYRLQQTATGEVTLHGLPLRVMSKEDKPRIMALTVLGAPGCEVLKM